MTIYTKLFTPSDLVEDKRSRWPEYSTGKLPDFQPTNPLKHVNFIAQYLKRFLLSLLAVPAFMEGTLVVVTFDESIPHADNHIYTVLLGDMVQANTVQGEIYNHYSLLRTIEESFSLGTLNRNDFSADFFRFLWGLDPPAFDWTEHSQ